MRSIARNLPRAAAHSSSSISSVILPPLLLLLTVCCHCQPYWPQITPVQPAKSDISTQASACDQLFSVSHNLANYCQCEDVDFELDTTATPGGQLITPTETRNGNRINQLSCEPKHLAQLVIDFGAVKAARTNSNSATDFRVDYLNINTKLASKHHLEPVQPQTTTSAAEDQHKLQLLIDHISLQLTTQPAHNHRQPLQATCTSAAANNSSTTTSAGRLMQTIIETQMIDFVGLINETHLQFLSIFVVGAQEPEDKTSGELLATDRADWQDETRESTIKFARLLAKLPALSRLELSLGVLADDDYCSPLVLNSESFRHQTALKWLNLGSNNQVKFDYDDRKSPFAYSSSLEYLSFESSNLVEFAMFGLFTTPFNSRHSQHNALANDQQATDQQRTYLGLPNLTSLNLASNKLSSLERDLFAHSNNTVKSVKISSKCQVVVLSGKHDRNSKVVFLLPALTQLDLSHNQLTQLTNRAGQLLLCSMPNLNQLYLQHNKLIHLNINSLLVSHPLAWLPSSIFTTKDWSRSEDISSNNSEHQFSKLEHLDLSYNRLIRITAINFQVTENVVTANASSSSAQPHRLRSINLSHNNLKRSLSSLDSSLVNKVIFKESFKGLEAFEETGNLMADEAAAAAINIADNALSLAELESHFTLSSNSMVSICDFLSPAKQFKLSRTTINNVQLSDEDELLNEVILTNNQLSRISNEEFASKRCRGIQILRLARNKIRLIDEKALIELRLLEQLDLSENSIADLRSSTFNKNTRLKVLDLSGNLIRALNDESLFSHLVELEQLFLDGNQLYDIKNDLFAQNSRLEILDLSKNKLSNLNESLLSPLKHLKVLNLHHNQLTRFTDHLFKMVTYFHATMHNNLYQHQSKESRPNSPAQKSLKPQASLAKKRQKSDNLKASGHPDKGKVSIIKTDQAKKRQNIRRRQVNDDGMTDNVLILANNKIEQFQFNLNCSQHPFGQNVKLLWLNDNHLRDLDVDSFKCLQSLQRLYLQSNFITNLDPNTFSHLNNLELLDMSSNQLRDFDFLQILTNQQQQEVQKESSPILQSIESVNLCDNPNLKIDSVHLIEFVVNSVLKRLNLGGVREIISTKDQEYRLKMNQLEDRPIHLELVNLSSTQVIDEIMINFLSNNSLVSIEKLDLSCTIVDRSLGAQNQINGLMMSRLKPFIDLVELNLAGNQYSSAQISRLLNNVISSNNEQLTTTTWTSPLTHLNLSSNQIEYWPIEDPKVAFKLNKLESLDLSKNRMRHLMRIEYITCYQFPQLQVLNLSSSGLIGLVDQLKHPMTADRKSQNLASLMPRIRQLDLSHNRLTWLPGRFFDDLSELTWLRLDHNQLESLSLSVLQPISAHNSKTHLLLDLSSNRKLLSVGDANAGIVESLYHRNENIENLRSLDDEQFNDLIIYDQRGFTDAYESRQRAPMIKCKSIDEYTVAMQTATHHRDVASNLPADVLLPTDYKSSRASHELAESGSHEKDNERCRHLINRLDSISLDSTLMQLIAIETIAGSAHTDRLIHLSLRNNAIRQLPFEHANTTGGGPNSNSKRVVNDIIQLDLSQNRIAEASRLMWNLCRLMPELRSLDLANNQIGEQVSLVDSMAATSSSCKHLTYLDLSSNKISSLKATPNRSQLGSTKANSPLLVLKLNHNSLTHLSDFDLSSFKSLRVVDLRFNKLKSELKIPFDPIKHPFVNAIISTPATTNSQNGFWTDQASAYGEADLMRPHLKLINGISLLIDWSRLADNSLPLNSTTQQRGYIMSIVQVGDAKGQNETSTLVHTEATTNHVIKFCALNYMSLNQVCFTPSTLNTATHNRDTSESTNKCFYLKIPYNISSCLTNLHQSGGSMVAPNEHSSTTAANHGQLISVVESQGSQSDSTSPTLDATMTNTDPVLNFIDFLKKTWLRLRKGINLNDYLTSVSNIRNDSIWLKLNGKYPIYTLTVIKFAIVAGSICVIALLIAMFTLLTCNSAVGKSLDSPRSISGSSGTEALTNDSTGSSGGSSLMKSSCGSTDQSAATTTCTSRSHSHTSQPATATATSGNSSSNTDNKQADLTVISSRRMNMRTQQQLDANQLVIQQQACSTPNSSLAASSVETAETMQAIDSIQSGVASANSHLTEPLAGGRSVDYYAPESQEQQRYYGHCNQQVATVMRMVKSNSANFDSTCSNSIKLASQTYGTLRTSNGNNYSTLKSKMRALYEQQRHQVYPTESARQHEQVLLPPPPPPLHLESSIEPYNYSEQSDYLASAPNNDHNISGGLVSNQRSHNYDAQDQQQVYHQQDPTTMSLLSISTALSSGGNFRLSASQQVSPASTTNGLGDPFASNLCQYHRLVQMEPAQVGVEQSESVILERAEEEEAEQLEHNAANDRMLMSNLPNLPLPPASRAIKVLENPQMQFMHQANSYADAHTSNDNDDNNNNTYNSRHRI